MQKRDRLPEQPVSYQEGQFYLLGSGMKAVLYPNLIPWWLPRRGLAQRILKRSDKASTRGYLH